MQSNNTQPDHPIIQLLQAPAVTPAVAVVQINKQQQLISP